MRIIALIFLFSSNLYGKLPAVVYHIRTKSVNKVVNCSATLLLVEKNNEERCALITNSHCIGENPIIINHDQDFTKNELRGQVFSTKNEIKIKFSTNIAYNKDLAEIDIPSEIRKRYCEQDLLEKHIYEDVYDLNNKDRIFRSPVIFNFESSKAIVGYSNNQFKLNFSSNSDWPNYKPTRSFITKTGMLGLYYLVEIFGLDMNHGMSGGFVFDQNNRIIGINKMFYPFQSIVRIIDIENIIHFIFNPTSINKQTNLAISESNSGANGGENSGANGGSDDNIQKQNLLKQLQEPQEGIVINGQRLLAINDKQIDGADDLRSYYDVLKRKNYHVIVFKNSLNFFGLKSKLIERLQGSYQNKIYITNERRFKSDGLKIIQPAVIDTNGLISFKVNINLNLNVSGSFSIEIVRIPYSSNSNGKFLSVKNNEFTHIRYKGHFLNNKYKDIELTNQYGQKLFCRNSNFLKLICSNQDENFSLSLSENSKKGILSFRRSKIYFSGAQKFILYQYGRLENNEK